jgi:(p)ppGpp synthase/HD superfamily hydrolase
MFSPLIEKALRLAARMHHGQRRKSSDIPYVTHLAGVALILQRAGFDDDGLIAAALLHDVVEDTDCTLADLAGEFPDDVVGCVRAASEEKLDGEGNKRPWRARKRDHIAQVAASPLEARAIVLADKLHNLGTMLFDVEAGENIWKRFGGSPGDVLEYHREMVAAAAGQDPSLQELADACREMIRRLEAPSA